MNGRGYKRTADEDEVCIRKKLKLSVGVEIEDPGGILLTAGHTHTDFTDLELKGTTTGLTKAMVGLDQVDNKSSATILDNPSMTGLTAVHTFKIEADGNEATPSLYWGEDTDTGFSHTPGVVCVSAEGTNTACFRTTGLQITQGNISFLLPGGTVDTVQVATLKSDHDAHVADVSTNPHAVTKADVGLTNVDDQSVATILNNSALTGVTTASQLTVNGDHTVTGNLEVVGAITTSSTVDGVDIATLESDHDAHMADVSTNPHAVTKADVGLTNVDDQSVATILNNSALTGVTTASQLTVNGDHTVTGNLEVVGAITNYIEVKSDGNPAAPSIYWGNDTDTGISHQEDVVCISTAGVNNACFRTDGVQINKGNIYFQTPGGLVDTVQVATLKSDHDAHVADVSTNPHAVTKADVGLTNVDDQSVATILDNSALTGQTTAADIRSASGGGLFIGNDQASGGACSMYMTSGVGAEDGRTSMTSDGDTWINADKKLKLCSSDEVLLQKRTLATQAVESEVALDNGTLTITDADLVTNGLIDTRDVAADGAMLFNLNTTLGLGSLTAAEVTQLQAIGTSTVSAAQWGYLGATDQGVATTDTPTFAGIVTGGNVDGVDVSDLSASVTNLGDIAFTYANPDLPIAGDRTNMSSGLRAGDSVSTGTNGIYIGQDAGTTCSVVGNNVMIGRSAGIAANASNNTFIGSLAHGNTPSNPADCTAVGYKAGYNVGGNGNTAIGSQAMGTLNATKTGTSNTAVGYKAMEKMRSGIGNVALGYESGNSLAAGSGNYATLLGFDSGPTLTTATENTFVGGYSGNVITTGVKNTMLGSRTVGLNTGTRQISLGHLAACDASNQMTIGGSLADDKITEVRPGSTDKTCDLGSGTNRFGTVYCDAVDINGSAPALGQAFTNPVDDTNMVAGTNAGTSITGPYSTNNICIGKNAGKTLGDSMSSNTFIGPNAGTLAEFKNSTCIGAYSGKSVTTGSLTAFGFLSAEKVSTGTSNCIIGSGGGSNLTTGNKCTGLGSTTIMTAGDDHQIAIGYQATCTAANQCVIGGSNGTSGITELRAGYDGICSLGSDAVRWTDIYKDGHMVTTYNPTAVTASSDTISAPITLYDTSSNTITATMPDAASNAGKTYMICLETHTNTLSVARAGTDTIDAGTTSLTLTAAGKSLSLTAVGTNWYVT